jgi:hypothetical protein
VSTALCFRIPFSHWATDKTSREIKKSIATAIGVFSAVTLEIKAILLFFC